MGLFKRQAPTPPNDTAGGAYPGPTPFGAPPFPVGFLGQQSLDSWWNFVTQTVWTGDVILDEQSALGVPAVSASLSLLAAYVTQMPLEAVKETDPHNSLVEPQPAIVNNPLGDPRATGLTFSDWIEPLLRDLALWGNHVGVLGEPAWHGWPTQMFPVMAGQWSVSLRDGRRIYNIGGQEFDAAEVFHIAINRRTGELVGRGLMNTNRDTLAAAIACERWAARYFVTGTVPSIHIAHPNPDLTQAQADDLKNKFLESAKGSRAPVVTPVGTDITVLPSDAESAQLVEARKWSNAALAIALGVEPSMLGMEGTSMTYRNIVEVNQQTINTTVMRYLVPVEQAITAQCLPRGIRARFQPSALARPDLGERITQSLQAYAGGVIDVDEARAMLDLAPNPNLSKTHPNFGAPPPAEQDPAAVTATTPTLQVVAPPAPSALTSGG